MSDGISEKTYFVAKQTRRILEDVAGDLWNAQEKLTQYEAVKAAARDLLNWKKELIAMSYAPATRGDDPFVKLKEALSVLEDV